MSLQKNSVYVRNLEERVKNEPLKETLHTIFSEFGNVIDIVAKTNLKAKGQAFIVYDNPEAARVAIEETDGFDLFGKPIQVALAKTRSDATVQKFGNDEDLELHKRRRAAEKGTWICLERKGCSLWVFCHPVMTASQHTNASLHYSQTKRRLWKPSSNALSALLPVATREDVLRRLQEALASRPLVLRPPLWFRTSTSPRTRFFSSKTFPTIAMWRLSPTSLAVSRASAKYVWCLDDEELRSSNTRTRRVPSVPRRVQLVCS